MSSKQDLSLLTEMIQNSSESARVDRTEEGRFLLAALVYDDCDRFNASAMMEAARKCQARKVKVSDLPHRYLKSQGFRQLLVVAYHMGRHEAGIEGPMHAENVPDEERIRRLVTKEGGSWYLHRCLLAHFADWVSPALSLLLQEVNRLLQSRLLPPFWPVALLQKCRARRSTSSAFRKR